MPFDVEAALGRTYYTVASVRYPQLAFWNITDSAHSLCLFNTPEDARKWITDNVLPGDSHDYRVCRVTIRAELLRPDAELPKCEPKEVSDGCPDDQPK